MFLNSEEWARFTFGQCQLGDKRRTSRLVKMATHMASHAGCSVVQSAPDNAHVEGSYRLIRNEQVSAEAIAQGGFQATAELAQDYDELLALEDTTSVSYEHSVASELGYTTGSLSCKRKGMLVHSVLLYAPQQQHTLGLIAQGRWVRKEEDFGGRHHNQKRDYHTKESYKWEQASEAMQARLGDSVMARCISVCDREADVIEYLAYKQAKRQRFVVRAKSNRPLAEGDRLYDHAEALTTAGHYRVSIPQRGGRKARQAELSIRYAPVSVLAPTRKQPLYPPITVYAVYCDEVTQGTTQPLQWVLLTTEPVTNTQQALKVVSYYEARWKVELFHKVWKSEGTNVEALRMQDVGNLERMMVIQAFIACRLMQLKDMGDSDVAQVAPCTLCLSELQWKILFKARHKQTPLPNTPPDIKWAYQALGKLAGWNDSKRSGRVGWKTLWKGWEKLETLVSGYQLFQDEM